MMGRLAVGFFLTLGALPGQSVVTPPIGFNKIICLPNSDTIVGVPFRQQGSREARVASPPQADPGNAERLILTLDVSNLPVGELHSHYVKFSSGAMSGRWFDIVPGTATADSVTLESNGADLGGVAAGDSVTIARHWTLETLFPPAAATTSWTEEPPGSGNWVPNGHAIVSSNSNSPLARRTEILLPDLAGQGINLLPNSVHFISGTTTKTWNKALQGGGFEASGHAIVYPDAYFVIRHAAAVSRPTVFMSVGDVEVSNRSIPLFTNTTGRQDNHIAIPRPLPLTLSDLGLSGTPAFVSSASTAPLARRDELLVFDNATALRNRLPSAVYFVVGGNWQKIVNNVPVAANDDVIPAGHGILIRKFRTQHGETVAWENPPSY